MRVRRVDASEAGRYRDIRLRSLREDPDAFGSTLERELALEDADWARRLERGATFVAEDAGEWIGTATGLPPGVAEPGAPAQLVGMWVAPAARGSGVADELVWAVVDWARGSDLPVLRLWVVEDNVRARRLYERWRFRDTGARFRRERDGRTEIEMERLLDD